MKQPLIGVVPLVDEARESYWMLPGYMPVSYTHLTLPTIA